MEGIMSKFIRCSKCVMDSTDPYITFDENGVCNHCHYFETFHSKGLKSTEELDKIVLEIKTKKRKQQYDCIIGISGGVDSSYIAYLTKTLGLRPLAVHVDNGWNSELAVKNIENLLKHLGIDLITYVLDWEEFRDLQYRFLLASTPDSEIPTDHAIAAVIFKIAAKYNIQYIISGSNISTESVGVRAWSYGHSDWRYIKSVNKLMGGRTLKKFPHYTFFDLFYFKIIKRQISNKLLNYIDYRKDAAIDRLKSEFDWKYYGGKHYESVYTRFFQGFYLPRKFGFDKRKTHLSSQISVGHISRIDAIEKLNEPIYEDALLKSDLSFVKKKLRITDDEFNKLLNAEPKRFEDYPSYETHFFLKYLKKNYKRLSLKFPLFRRIGF